MNPSGISARSRIIRKICAGSSSNSLRYRIRWRARRRGDCGVVFQAAFDAEPHPSRKEGKARFAANTDLRNHLEQHTPQESSRG